MKKILTIIGLILINLGLIYLSFWLHYELTEKIIRTTNAPNGIESMFFVPIFIIGLFFFITNKKFRLFGIGLTALCISSVIFVIFYANKHLAAKGKYENFKLRNTSWTDNSFFLNIDFNMWYNSTEVTQENCLDVDSVQVRIDKGFFGMRTMTNDVRIVESLNCLHDEIDTTNVLKSHIELGNNLSQKRCFKGAIDHYSICIELDSLNPYCYYQRGLMFMAIKNYEKALVDFLTSAVIQYGQFDKKKIEQIDNDKILSYTREFLNKLDKKEYDHIEEYINSINTINDFDTYQKRILFCMEKLEEK
jgi:tetratricopeptide (TPR) repeat protein